jgi:hypothetical protein
MRGVIWDADFEPEDYGYEGVGVVHECHCEFCGAEITYVVLFGEEGADDGLSKGERNVGDESD